jgi:thymidylate synthase
MKDIILPVLSEQEKIEKSRENFLIFTQLKNNVNNELMLLKLKEIANKYNTTEITDEQLELIKNKLDSFEKGSDELLKFIEKIINSKYSSESQYKIFGDKKFNAEIKQIITNNSNK